MACPYGEEWPLPIPYRPAALAPAPGGMSEFPFMSTETGHLPGTPNTIPALDLSGNALNSPVPPTYDAMLALDLASVNHTRIRPGRRVRLTASALFAHNLAYDGPSILLGSARRSSAAAPAPRPTPVPEYLYHTPVVPPVTHWFPSIVNSQPRTRRDALMRRAGVEVLYTQPALMADDTRLDWEHRFMGYFRWNPWSRESGEHLVEWVRENKHDSCWSSSSKEVFEKASQSGYPQKRFYPAFKKEAVLDKFTYGMQCMLLQANIFNLVIARMHPDYYVVVPVGRSRPVYNPDDFTPLEKIFISTWYPFWFLLLAELPGESRQLTFRREFMRVSDTLRGYYIEGTPYWRGCAHRLQPEGDLKGSSLSS